MRYFPGLIFCSLLPLVLLGCGPGQRPQRGEGEPDLRDFRPIDRNAAAFWDRQTAESAELLRELAREFNADRAGMPIKIEHIGGYTDIYRKVTASIQARTLPAMAVGYESMTSEYVQAGAAVPLDAFINDPEVGLPLGWHDDFFVGVIETNQFPQFGNRMYSFPFSKSVLMLYFNKNVLREAGIEAPPETWDEFLRQCRQVKARTGKYAHAIAADCSTVDGMIFSMGGEVVRDGGTLFDSPEALRAFELYETLVKEDLAFQVSPGTYDDEVALAQDRIAFALRSSSGRAHMAELMGDDEKWGMACIPQADPENPRTVLYGPNVCIFNVTREQQEIAWEFIKFFTSPEATVRWALETGYLPIRRSAANSPEMQQFWDEWPYNRAGFDCLMFARPEPNLAGWQEVRGLVEDAVTAILTGMKTAPRAARDLKAAADTVLDAQ